MWKKTSYLSWDKDFQNPVVETARSDQDACKNTSFATNLLQWASSKAEDVPTSTPALKDRASRPCFSGFQV
jgi:hypothetical protein